MTREKPRLCIEALEDRTLLATCHVTRLSDVGGGMGFRGDFRYCVNKVNTATGPDSIDFRVTGTINLTGALPELSTEMDIVGPGPDLLEIRRKTGGDYRIFSVTSGTTVRIVGLTIVNGRVVNDGGGGIMNRGTLQLEHMNVKANGSVNGTPRGGGIYNDGSLIISRSLIDSNWAQYYDINVSGAAYGGGIYNSGMLTISESSLLGNIATATSIGGSGVAYGGGIYNSGTLTVSESSLENVAYASAGNDASGYGGGIHNAGGVATIIRSTITGNYAYADSCNAIPVAYGAGISGSGSLTILDSTVSHNHAHAGSCNDSGYSPGAGIWYDGQVILSNSTVTENWVSCNSWGPCGTGGIGASGTWVVTHATIWNDLVISGNVTLRNSILDSITGKITSSGYNLVGNSGGGSGYVPSDILDVDPLLGPLADNGGPTLTMALLPGSPAIDSGTNHMAPEWDQRGPGYPRIVNGTIDRGAFEVQSSFLPIGTDELIFLTTALVEDDE